MQPSAAQGFTCSTKNRLFEEYRLELGAFKRLVDRYVRRDPLTGTLAQVEEARRRVYYAREKIQEHCTECGCDPEWLERTSAS